MAESMIRVEVALADAGFQDVRTIELARGCTVMQAIDAWQLSTGLVTGEVDPTRLGIFSRKVSPDQILRDGDRIEIYRPLLIDPMEARRQRARRR